MQKLCITEVMHQEKVKNAAEKVFSTCMFPIIFADPRFKN